MATWNERIDNLQARLANLVSEEFAGANFYNTDISVSDYNPSIDTTVTLTITVTNAEGDPVEGASVPVTASEGQFTKLNNTTITAASSVTGTTNSSGQFTLTYSCTEWGLITFSANNGQTQIKVKGYKAITLTNGTLYVNGETRTCELHYSKTGVVFSSANTWTFIETVSQIANYPPVDNNIFVQCSNPTILARVYATGSIQARNTQTGNDVAVGFSVMWHY